MTATGATNSCSEKTCWYPAVPAIRFLLGDLRSWAHRWLRTRICFSRNTLDYSWASRSSQLHLAEMTEKEEESKHWRDFVSVNSSLWTSNSVFTTSASLASMADITNRSQKSSQTWFSLGFFSTQQDKKPFLSEKSWHILWTLSIAYAVSIVKISKSDVTVHSFHSRLY